MSPLSHNRRVAASCRACRLAFGDSIGSPNESQPHFPQRILSLDASFTCLAFHSRAVYHSDHDSSPTLVCTCTLPSLNSQTSVYSLVLWQCMSVANAEPIASVAS